MRSPRARALLAGLLLPLAACGEDGGGWRWPEEEWAYGISMALYRSPEGGTSGQALVRAQNAKRRIEAGEAFADVARETSDDESSRVDGGFLGFVNPRHETRFAGAIQVLAPGETRGPLATQIGFQIVHRHPFDEARDLERRHRLPVHGFLVSWRDLPDGQDRSEEEARARAEEALAKLRSKEIDLATALQRYGDGPAASPNGFLGVATRGPRTAHLFEAVKDVPEGSYAPVVRLPGGYGVLYRAPHLRSFVRHILIQHAGVQDRDLSVRRSPAEALEIARRVVAEAKPDGSNWSDLVARFSDDALSAPVNGSLGAIGNGEVHPALEAAILAATPGRIGSQIAETPGGFHVVWRVN